MIFLPSPTFSFISSLNQSTNLFGSCKYKINLQIYAKHNNIIEITCNFSKTMKKHPPKVFIIVRFFQTFTNDKIIVNVATQQIICIHNGNIDFGCRLFKNHVNTHTRNMIILICRLQ